MDVVGKDVCGRTRVCDRGVNVDIVSENIFKNLTQLNTFTNALVYMADGIQPSSASISIEQMNFVIESIKNRMYCHWSDMGEKDRVFFSTFEKIPKDVCNRYGFYRYDIWDW